MDSISLSGNWNAIKASINSEFSTPISNFPRPSTSARHSSLPAAISSVSMTRPRINTSDIPSTKQRKVSKDGTLHIPLNLSSAPLPASRNIRFPHLDAKRSRYPVTSTVLSNPSKSGQAGKYVALDCEMVGVGSIGKQNSVLARVSIVDYNHNVLLDLYVQPPDHVVVTDYRTHVSGIRPHHLTPSNGAVPFKEARRRVRAILSGRWIVGHDLRNDLKVLEIQNEVRQGRLVCGIRDTSLYKSYRELNCGNLPSLRFLAATLLGIHMQGMPNVSPPLSHAVTSAASPSLSANLPVSAKFKRSFTTSLPPHPPNPHDSVEDARTAMKLFQFDKAGMERQMSRFDFRSASNSAYH